jgi:hypothetical protein
MEKIISQRLIWELECMGALSEFQYGFRLFRSTSDPLLLLEHDIRQAFGEERVLLEVFFDLEKAYDSTWRGGILKNSSFCALEVTSPCLFRTFFPIAPFRCESVTAYPVLLNFKKEFHRAAS